MVDSKAKGARGELLARDWFREATNLPWERTPGSGALSAAKKLKGDLYVPNEKNFFTIEVKNYEEDGVASSTLTHKSNNFLSWWTQSVREAKENGNKPLTLYKWNRSAWYIAVDLTVGEDWTNKFSIKRYMDIAFQELPTCRIFVADDLKSHLVDRMFVLMV